MLKTSRDSAGALLTIDLDAIRANYRLLRETLGATACAGVVKADAYGLGAAQVAAALEAEGCRTFFVAHVAEGVALRETVGADTGIFVLNGLPPGSERDGVDAGLVPVLNSLEQAAAWRAEAARLGRRLPALFAATRATANMLRESGARDSPACIALYSSTICR